MQTTSSERYGWRAYWTWCWIHPADDEEQRCISCYLTDLETLDTGEDGVRGVKFSFRAALKHNATLPDVELVLVRERNPPVWINCVGSLLFGALNRPPRSGWRDNVTVGHAMVWG
jgi:hypothetical protein